LTTSSRLHINVSYTKFMVNFYESLTFSVERLYQEDPSPNVIWLADDYVASLSQRLSQLAHTFGVLVPSLQDTGTASGQ
jgi:hypothetical protein